MNDIKDNNRYSSARSSKYWQQLQQLAAQPWSLDKLFTQDTDAISQIVTALRIDAFNQPGLAISLIITGALQGMGDTKSPLYSTAFGMWGLRIIGVIFLGQYLGLGIAGVWLSIGIDLYFRSIYLTNKFRKNIGSMHEKNTDVMNS